MNNRDICRTLIEGETVDVADLNDWAVNTIRDYCRPLGYNAKALVVEESRRIDADNHSLVGYIKCRRVGSKHRLTRSVRRAVWAAIVTRDILTEEIGDLYDMSQDA